MKKEFEPSAYSAFSNFARGAGIYREFRDAFLAHRSNGYIFSTPEAFIMGRAVAKDGRDEDISDPWHRFPENSDTWFIWAAAGDISEMLKFLPYEKKWVAWARKGVIRFHGIEVIDRIQKIEPFINNGRRRQ